MSYQVTVNIVNNERHSMTFTSDDRNDARRVANYYRLKIGKFLKDDKGTYRIHNVSLKHTNG